MVRMVSFHDLLATRRKELVERWTNGVEAEIMSDSVARNELVDQMPRFVDDLVTALHPDAIPLPGGSHYAAEHGLGRLRLGFNVRDVVREYLLLHLATFDMAIEN